MTRTMRGQGPPFIYKHWACPPSLMLLLPVTNVTCFTKVCLNVLNKILRYRSFSLNKSIFDKTFF